MKSLLAILLIMTMAASILLPAAAAEDPVEQLMKDMSLRDKVTQMLMVDFRYWDEDPTDDREAEAFTVMNAQVKKILEDYHFGAVLYFAQNLADTRQAFLLTQAMQEAAVQGGGIPMLIAADQEGGSVYRLTTGTALPGNMALGAAGDVEYARLAGRIIGSELSALGINTNLAPVVDVNNNAANPVIGLRSYSDDAETVGQMASAMISGMAQFQVVGCAKHFPGHGDSATDSHYGLPSVDKSLEQLRGCELLPYEIAIDRGIEMIMTAHILYPQLEQERLVSQKTGAAEALPATMSHAIITGLLKEQMGFEGIVVTDAMNMAGVADYWDPVQAAVNAIRAGADMICMPCTLSCREDVKTLESIVAGITAAVEEGALSTDRIDDAVRRILTVKKNRGILNGNGSLSEEKALAVVGCEANREAERHIAAKAVTVIENRNGTLPLRLTGDSRVLMLVPYNNEKAQMILGWNRAAQAGLIPPGAQVQVVRFDAETTLDTFRREIDWADTLIFNSEISRADRLNGGRWESAYILQAGAYSGEAGKTVIVQSVDKPYDVQSYPDADAVLAVYGCKGSSLDPTEALTGGVTGSEAAFGPNIVAGIEVIFGVFGAEGKLPVDIPKYENGGYTGQILYPRGYGLHYESLLPEPEIPEPTAQTQPLPEQYPTETPVQTTGQPQQIPESGSRTGLWAAAAVLCAAVLLPGRAGKKRRK